MLTRRLAFLAAGESGESSAESRLTARELQIIRLVDDGLSNKQIAQTLQIQVARVKNHRQFPEISKTTPENAGWPRMAPLRNFQLDVAISAGLSVRRAQSSNRSHLSGV